MKAGKAKPQILETNQLGNANSNPVLLDDYHDDEDDDGSLVPKRPCKRPTISPEANQWRGKASAIIVNRWCGMDKESIPTEEQLLEWDAQRAKSIQARFAAQTNAAQKEEPVHLKAIPGTKIKSASFVVEVGIGNPPTNQYLIFDTGSMLTWVQCVSCKPCFPQNCTRFDPRRSRKIECGSVECKKMSDAKNSCRARRMPCEFGVSYADESSISGDFFKDKLTLGNQVVSNYYTFGCANNFTDPTGHSFRGSSGIMGLQWGNPESIVDQAAKKFHKSFSYCLPSGMNNYGHLTFGPSQDSDKSRFKATIPIIGNKEWEYFVALVGITVGKTRLNIPTSVFSRGALIDSGTVKTWLPQIAYAKLQEEFVKQMGAYTRVPGKTTEACYDLTKFPKPHDLPIPKIRLHFSASGNEDTIELSDKGVMGGEWHKRCLWFAPNDEPDDNMTIIGGSAQQTFDFVFDLNNKHILVGPLGCK